MLPFLARLLQLAADLSSRAKLAIAQQALGVSMTTADKRVKRGPYPLTWENLSKSRLEQP